MMDVIGAIGIAGIFLGFLPLMSMGKEETERLGAVVTSMIFFGMGIMMILVSMEN